MRKFLLLLTLISSNASAVDFVLPSQSEMVNGTNIPKADVYSAAANSASTSSQAAMSKMDEDTMNSMVGIEANNSMANFGGSNTNLSVTRKGTVEIKCNEEIGVNNKITSTGIQFTSKSCSMSGEQVSSINFSWCSFRNGFECDNGADNDLSVSMAATVPMGEGNVKLDSCTKRGSRYYCILQFTSVTSDSFEADGNNLQETGRDRENANPSFALDSLVNNTNSPYQDVIDKESKGSADYVVKSHQKLNDEGKIDIYRNSPEDIAIYGHRNGELGIPYASQGETQACTNVDFSNLESCSVNHQLTEFNCPPAEDLFCDYERAHKEEICFRKKVASCSTMVACKGKVEADQNPVFKNFSQQIYDYDYLRYVNACSNGNQSECPKVASWEERFWDYSFSYPSFRIWNGPDNAMRKGFHSSITRFTVDDLDKVKSFFVGHVSIDDAASLWVNGNFIQTASHGWTSQGVWVAGYSNSKVRWQSGEGFKNDKGQTSLDWNIDLTRFIKEGVNEIKINVGVIGGGDANFNFKAEAYCQCEFDVQEESKCDAIIPVS